ncbi:NAD-dependent epimerase/dehydratase family protein [Planococcus sp. ISL-110]|uniref:NAD-dependent epimerase/dehydratase family protein n=1 Tax=Planococcus sp. ISL-110 TaxID=2819167 RepID=UPI001BE5A93B|nr:NAD-dependent epimerase/dehydratase family protein [Planococcus sp. ISL-110]MBT2570456.1 NAD-dependent epimerase/dehydratase family protein [Planococcus sp. ISL-110]
MKVLIIGGTSFVGRHIVEKLLENGHEVVLFNRGKSNPGIFPELRRIIGDRRKDAVKLANERWDAVIDTSAYTPADLQPILENITTDHYTFISTISVYNNFKQGPVKENVPVPEVEVEGDDVTGETYGPFKVMCERLIEERLSDEALIIRPGIVVGPADPTDRFTYWAIKLNGTGPILIPGTKTRKLQWIDARDLAEFTVSQIEKKATGVFNVVADPVSMEEFVSGVAFGEAETVWVDDRYLLGEGLQAFELPFWIPISADFPEGFMLVDNEKAKNEGLTFRSLEESAKDTLQWSRTEGLSLLKAGIDEEKERDLLKKLKI